MLYITRHPSESPYHLIGHMYLFLDYMMQSAKSAKLVPGGKMSDFYIKEAMNYIEQNFQNDISIEDIARVCGINRSYLGKIFKNSVGHSPQEFLMNYRMIKATELLKLTSLSIADVGSAVGYEISFISHAPLKISTEWLRGSGGTSINKLTVHPSQIHLHCHGSPSHTADKHTFYPQTLCFSCYPRWLPDRQAEP